MPKTDVARYLKRPYARVVVPEPDGGFSARVLEFPGCVAEGDDLEKAYRNLERAARTWLSACLAQDMAIPEPAETETYSGRILLRLPRSLHRRASESAQRDGVSLNQCIVAAISERLGAERVASAAENRLQEALEKLEREALTIS